MAADTPPSGSKPQAALTPDIPARTPLADFAARSNNRAGHYWAEMVYFRADFQCFVLSNLYLKGSQPAEVVVRSLADGEVLQRFRRTPADPQGDFTTVSASPDGLSSATSRLLGPPLAARARFRPRLMWLKADETPLTFSVAA